MPPPRWIKPVIFLSIPWAVSIHTVTAFLYSGLAARPFWLTAVLAPRFLASAFASGPALLILLCLLLRGSAAFDAGKEAIAKLAVIVTYAMAINVFFVLVELFTALYSDIPEHVAHFEYLFLGLARARHARPLDVDGGGRWRPARWSSCSVPEDPEAARHPRRRLRRGLRLDLDREGARRWWSPASSRRRSARSRRTVPTAPELLIAAGIYAVGLLLITLLYKIALSVRGEVAT